MGGREGGGVQLYRSKALFVEKRHVTCDGWALRSTRRRTLVRENGFSFKEGWERRRKIDKVFKDSSYGLLHLIYPQTVVTRHREYLVSMFTS